MVPVSWREYYLVVSLVVSVVLSVVVPPAPGVAGAVVFVGLKRGDCDRNMKRNREKIALLSTAFQNLIARLVVSLIEGQTIFCIVYLFNQFLVNPGFNIKHEITGHDFLHTGE